MYRRDYLLRMIDQMIDTMHKIIGLRAINDQQGALDLIEQGYRRFTRFDADTIRAATCETLIGLFSFNGELNLGECVATAELLKEEGDVYAELGDDNAAYEALYKSLCLFGAAIDVAGPALAQDRLTRIESVVAGLARYDLSAGVSTRIFRLFAGANRLDRAEDWLFRAIDGAASSQAIVEEGIGLFERLLLRTDHELELGGLSRDEVASTLAELQAKRG